MGPSTIEIEKIRVILNACGWRRGEETNNPNIVDDVNEDKYFLR